MSSSSHTDEMPGSPFVSTGRLPEPETVQSLMAEAYQRLRVNTEGTCSDVYPALALVPRDLFGMCVVGTSGRVFAVGDAEYEFSIMSVSKPFVFALVCQTLGSESARRELGVNSTGLPFNSLAAIERSGDGRTNPMVNAGAIAATSLVPGLDRRRQVAGHSRRPLPVRGPHALAERGRVRVGRADNSRNQAIARLLESSAGSTATRPRRPTSIRGSAP